MALIKYHGHDHQRILTLTNLGLEEDNSGPLVWDKRVNDGELQVSEDVAQAISQRRIPLMQRLDAIDESDSSDEEPEDDEDESDDDDSGDADQVKP